MKNGFFQIIRMEESIGLKRVKEDLLYRVIESNRSIACSFLHFKFIVIIFFIVFNFNDLSSSASFPNNNDNNNKPAFLP